MKFRVLGPLNVQGGRSALASMRQRALLAALLLRANEEVETTYLIDAVWEDPPTSAVSNLRTYVVALRRALGQNRLRTGATGYQLVVRPGELDVAVFNSLLERAAVRDEPAEVADLLHRALALWRGEPLQGLDTGHALWPVVEALVERRGIALERYASASFALGTSTDLIPQLRRSVHLYPLRESLWALLIEAQYRAGQRAEALDTYTRLRRQLRDELGVAPTDQLQHLYQRIVAHHYQIH